MPEKLLPGKQKITFFFIKIPLNSQKNFNSERGQASNLSLISKEKDFSPLSSFTPFRTGVEMTVFYSMELTKKRFLAFRIPCKKLGMT